VSADPAESATLMSPDCRSIHPDGSGLHDRRETRAKTVP